MTAGECGEARLDQFRAVEALYGFQGPEAGGGVFRRQHSGRRPCSCAAMASLIDEDCGGEGDADAMIEVATSGLPAPQVERLLRRREVMMNVPLELRRAASRRLSSMFRNGAWGPPEDARAVEEWKRVQMELAEAVQRSPEHPAEEMEKVFEKENRLQDAGWVGFTDMNMNNGKEGK